MNKVIKFAGAHGKECVIEVREGWAVVKGHPGMAELEEVVAAEMGGRWGAPQVRGGERYCNHAEVLAKIENWEETGQWGYEKTLPVYGELPEWIKARGFELA